MLTCLIIITVTDGDGPDFSAIHDLAVLKVDLDKAQKACEKLSDQLITAETARDEFEKELNEQREELTVARKAKDLALSTKEEMEKRLDVLQSYFNQRESDLQKQLGMTANRLSDTTDSSESAVKRITLLTDELENTKSQLRTLKKEMEDQERSLKAQNATLEKKQHESWVTVRQETRRSAEAREEMATLRTRLTVVESQLVEKEFEISNLKEENENLKETVERISRASQVKSEPGKSILSLTSVFRFQMIMHDETLFKFRAQKFAYIFY